MGARMARKMQLFARTEERREQAIVPPAVRVQRGRPQSADSGGVHKAVPYQGAVQPCPYCEGPLAYHDPVYYDLFGFDVIHEWCGQRIAREVRAANGEKR